MFLIGQVFFVGTVLEILQQQVTEDMDSSSGYLGTSQNSTLSILSSDQDWF